MKKKLPGKPQSLIKILRWTLNFNLCDEKGKQRIPTRTFCFDCFFLFFFFLFVCFLAMFQDIRTLFLLLTCHVLKKMVQLSY